MSCISLTHYQKFIMKLTADPYLKGNFTLPIAHWDNIFTNDELDEISNYCSRIGTDESATIGVNKFHNDDVPQY